MNEKAFGKWLKPMERKKIEIYGISEKCLDDEDFKIPRKERKSKCKPKPEIKPKPKPRRSEKIVSQNRMLVSQDPTSNTGVKRGQTNPLLALLQSGFEGMRLKDTLFETGDEMRG